VRWSCSILRQPKTAPPRALQQARKLDADECWAERAAGCVCSRGHCARWPAGEQQGKANRCTASSTDSQSRSCGPVVDVACMRVFGRGASPSQTQQGAVEAKTTRGCCSCDHRRQAQAKHGSSTVFRTPPLRPRLASCLRGSCTDVCGGIVRRVVVCVLLWRGAKRPRRTQLRPRDHGLRRFESQIARTLPVHNGPCLAFLKQSQRKLWRRRG